MQISQLLFTDDSFHCCRTIVFSCRKSDRTTSNRSKRTGDDEDSSNEISPVMNEALSLKNNGKLPLVNGRPDIIYTSDQGKSMHYADPWIPRSDQPLSSNSFLNDNQRQKSIQYETRLYYHSLSSTSDEHLCQQQQRQPLLNNIDKDIEYVESRLRGQTTVSLPASHTNSYTRDASWRRHPPRNLIDISPMSSEQRQNPLMHQKYPTMSQTQSNNESTLSSPKSNLRKSLSPMPTNTNGSVKTVKSRMEKMKDQKAAKTLR